MRVLTYHEVIPGDHFADANAMLALCRQSWEAAGFDVHVLGSEHALQHPAHDVRRYADVVTVNPVWYELACWRRWMAYSTVMRRDERVLVIDTDVICCGMRPEDLYAIPNRGRITALTDAYTPAVLATGVQMEEWVMETTRPGRCMYIDGRPHYSDMVKAMQRPDLFDHVHIVGDWRAMDGPHACKAAHVSHSATRGQNRLAIAGQVAILNRTRLESASQGSTKSAALGCR